LSALFHGRCFARWPGALIVSATGMRRPCGGPARRTLLTVIRQSLNLEKNTDAIL
jgi:hypothetical protein